MTYLNRDKDKNTEESMSEYLSLNNDWDLDAAFLNSSNPFLSIIIQLDMSKSRQCEPLPSSFDEWDVISTHELKPTAQIVENKYDLSKSRKSLEKSLNMSTKSFNRSGSFNYPNSSGSAGKSFISLWSNSAADKAVSVFQKMLSGISRSNSFTSTNSSSHSNHNVMSSFNSSTSLSYSQYNPMQHVIPNATFKQHPNEFNRNESLQFLYASTYYISKPPLGDTEYRNFIDSDGRIVQLHELRQRIFDGGCEPSIRKEIWPILLGIFPNQASSTSKQRSDFIKQKSADYVQLKASLWFNLNKSLLKNNKQINESNSDQLHTLANKIQKDVWRTDRCHRFYSGDSNKNIESLFNILLTYSLKNGNFYAQGMSDLLSPLLFVFRDEPLSYVCFQALMSRCANNFDIVSEAIANKINLLTALLSRYDPVFWIYLSQFGADQLLFVYRWLLIECKREFPFNDSIRVLEVMWSTIETYPSTWNLRNKGSNSNTDDYLISDVEYSDSSSLITSNERFCQNIKVPCPASNMSNEVNKKNASSISEHEKSAVCIICSNLNPSNILIIPKLPANVLKQQVEDALNLTDSISSTTSSSSNYSDSELNFHAVDKGNIISYYLMRMWYSTDIFIRFGKLIRLF